MSALWTPGLAGVNPWVLVAQPSVSTTGPPPPSPDRRLRWVSVVMVRRRPRLEPALPRSCLESVYSTRVGIH